MSLTAITNIKNALSHRPEELLEAKRNGRVIIGWLNYNIPEEILYALDFIPIRLGYGGNDKLVDIGSRYISTKNCVYVREMTGLFAENKDPYIKVVDLVAADTTCLQVYRLAELIKYYFKTNTIILDVPRSPESPEGTQYFYKELLFFVEKLEAISGQKLDFIKLEKSVELYNKIRKAIQELYKYQAGDNPQSLGRKYWI
jgi:benzoyl-CoA reductase/2-hydroxyglutaryl-CoA dehydratase subunit BcrC/BadD/HgdB